MKETAIIQDTESRNECFYNSYVHVYSVRVYKRGACTKKGHNIKQKGKLMQSWGSAINTRYM